MSKKFEHWTPTMPETGLGQLAVFFTALSQTGYQAGQVRFLKENPEVAAKLNLGEEVLQQAWDSYDGDWDAVESLEVRIPE